MERVICQVLFGGIATKGQLAAKGKLYEQKGFEME
jgi:hypothetical protein